MEVIGGIYSKIVVPQKKFKKVSCSWNIIIKEKKEGVLGRTLLVVTLGSEVAMTILKEMEATAHVGYCTMTMIPTLFS